MNNNDIIRQIRYIFDYNDQKMIELFKLGGAVVSKENVINWLKKDDEPHQISLHDKSLATFLNGMIIALRGKKEGEDPKPEKSLNNNIVFRKLKIALDLKDLDILAILDSVGMRISKHELSAFFRKPIQSQYRLCNDQIMRNFLHGLQVKHRGE